MVTRIRKTPLPMTKEQFEAWKIKARELESLMDSNGKSLNEGLENLKKIIQKELGWK